MPTFSFALNTLVCQCVTSGIDHYTAKLKVWRATQESVVISLIIQSLKQTVNKQTQSVKQTLSCEENLVLCTDVRQKNKPQTVSRSRQLVRQQRNLESTDHHAAQANPTKESQYPLLIVQGVFFFF